MKFLLFSSFARLVLDRDPQRVSGGAELQMGLLAQALVQRGHEVTLLGAGTDFTDEPVIDGVQIRVGGRFDSGGLLDTLRSFVRVAQVLKTDRPEWVVIMGAGTWLWLLWLLQLPLGFAVAFITASDIDADGSYRKMFPLRGWLYEFALGRVARTIAMSGINSVWPPTGLLPQPPACFPEPSSDQGYRFSLGLQCSTTQATRDFSPPR